MKPIRCFRHVVCEPPGYLGTMLEARGYPFEVVCLDQGVDVPRDLDTVAGLVFMGGAGNVCEPTEWMQQELDLIARAVERGIPMLGICLGAQLIGRVLGGSVMSNPTLEIGWHPVEQVADASASGWFAGLPPRFEVFQWHAHTFTIPPGAIALLRGRCAEHQAFALGNILALQFHIEIMPHSIEGLTQRFSSDIEQLSDCVQGADVITADLEARTNRLHRIADVVFGRWLQTVYG
ncbi:MAG TPA: type 1 glutamine amidotransferase [Gammaproteobacteria bacterium]|nr:type 1 glutamine amidotransferase [Gammaproteobacteria bacterium]